MSSLLREAREMPQIGNGPSNVYAGVHSLKASAPNTGIAQVSVLVRCSTRMPSLGCLAQSCGFDSPFHPEDAYFLISRLTSPLEPWDGVTANLTSPCGY